MTHECTWLASELRAAGLVVVETPGWTTRGRSSKLTPIGVMVHHTASGKSTGAHPSLGVVIKGRPDLAGPLCQVLIGRDGVAHVIAAGSANHAGAGGPWRRIGRDMGNRYLVGIEIEHAGTSAEEWTPVQTAAASIASAAIVRHVRTGARYCLGHKEWAPKRKIDPHGWDMGEWRDRVSRLMREMDERAKASAKAKPVATAAKIGTRLNIGSRGPSVIALQVAVRSPRTGTFGPECGAAVRALQVAHGLRVDGRVGSATWPVVVGALPSLRLGSRGSAVRAAQQLMGVNDHGALGPGTQKAVRRAQAVAGLPVTGVVDGATWVALLAH